MLGRTGRAVPAKSLESHIAPEATCTTTTHNVVSVEMDCIVVGKCIMWHVTQTVCWCHLKIHCDRDVISRSSCWIRGYKQSIWQHRHILVSSSEQAKPIFWTGISTFEAQVSSSATCSTYGSIMSTDAKASEACIVVNIFTQQSKKEVDVEYVDSKAATQDMDEIKECQLMTHVRSSSL